ncbi:MAG: hypothetical protein ACR2MS_02620 [Weeksellaceae bacterium]
MLIKISSWWDENLARGAGAGALAGAGMGATRQIYKNYHSDKNDRKSIGKAALKGGAVGGAVGLAGAGIYNQGSKKGYKKTKDDTYKRYYREAELEGEKAGKDTARKGFTFESGDFRWTPSFNKRASLLDQGLRGAGAGALAGAGIGATRQALKNRKLHPKNKKSIGDAALKGGAIGAGVGGGAGLMYGLGDKSGQEVGTSTGRRWGSHDGYWHGKEKAMKEENQKLSIEAREAYQKWKNGK